jgi:hypothetical protein
MICSVYLRVFMLILPPTPHPVVRNQPHLNYTKLEASSKGRYYYSKPPGAALRSESIELAFYIYSEVSGSIKTLDNLFTYMNLEWKRLLR